VCPHNTDGDHVLHDAARRLSGLALALFGGFLHVTEITMPTGNEKNYFSKQSTTIKPGSTPSGRIRPAHFPPLNFWVLA
jgi:hypothetical protein